MVKQKLTLSVDREIVEKAKKWGINLSNITEKVLEGYLSDIHDKLLEGYSFADARTQPEEYGLYDGYKQLFDSITPLMKKFGVEGIVIAEGWTGRDEGEEYYEYDYNVVLLNNGSFFGGEDDIFFRDIKKINPEDFLPPKKILANLMNALVGSREARKEKMKEILIVKRIVDAITEPLTQEKSTTAAMRSKEKP